MNGDGYITPADGVYVINRLGLDDLSADVSGDGFVLVDDVAAVLVVIGT